MVLAHQGGWDEALIVLAPMLVFFGLLLVANRRAARMEAAEQAEQAEQELAHEGVSAPGAGAGPACRPTPPP